MAPIGGGNSQDSGNAHGNNPHGNGVDPCTRGQGKKVGLNCDEVPPDPGEPPGGGGSGSGPRAGASEKKLFFYHSDHVGSTSWLTDPSGSQFQRLAYFPFGETWIDEGSDSITDGAAFRFTGKELDPETSLHYFGARYLDSRLGKFISTDPALEESGALTSRSLVAYQYASSSPVTRFDPDGRADWSSVWRSVKAGQWNAARANLGACPDCRAETQVARFADAAEKTRSVDPIDFYSGGAIPSSPSDVVFEMHANVRQAQAQRASELKTAAVGMWPVAKYYASTAGPELALGGIGMGANALDDALALKGGYSGTMAMRGGGLVLLDSDVTTGLRTNPTLSGRINVGEQPVISYVTTPEMRNAVARGTGGLRGVPGVLGQLPVLGRRPSIDLRINLRGRLERERGRFGDAIIGAQAIENRIPLITNDRELRRIVIEEGGTVR